MKKSYVYFAVFAVAVIAGGFFFFRSQQSSTETLSVSHTDFINQISVSGKVVAAEEVEMGFKNSGRIVNVFYSVDPGKNQTQVVRRGAAIAKVDAKDAEQSVKEAQISLESAKLALAKLKLENSEENMNADLVKSYEDSFTAVSDAYIDLSNIITGLEDILGEDVLAENVVRTSGSMAVNYRETSEKLYYQALKSFKDNRTSFRLLDRNSSRQEIESIINKTYETSKVFSDAIKSMKNLVDYMADDTEDRTVFLEIKTNLSGYSDSVNEHLSSLLASKTDIKNYKDVFPSTSLDFRDLELTIRQKENDLADARNQLSDYYIRAPFDGVITKIDAKVGEIASLNTPLVTMMSADKFQVESFVPEINIALIKLGDSATVTLDAYGEDTVFDAKVVAIDPAETERDGVSTYKIKLQFDIEDERVKSGMTANVSVLIFSKPNVIVLPGGVVFEKDWKKYVQLKEGKKIVDREVFLGEVSSLGQVEVTSGLEDGEMVVLNPNS